MENRNDIAKYVYDLIYHRYLMKKSKARNIFVELDISEYLALHSISKVASGKNDLSSKAYLYDLSEQMEMSMPDVSKIITGLKNRGFVLWSHDGDGSEGTYVVITQSGINAISRQDDVLNNYCNTVIDRFGQDNLITLMEQMKKLEAIMDTDFSEKE